MSKSSLLLEVATVLNEQGCGNVRILHDCVYGITPGGCSNYRVEVLDDGRLLEFVDDYSDPETHATMVAFRKSWQDGAVDLSVLVQAVFDRIARSCEAPSMGYEDGSDFEQAAINHVADNYDVDREELRAAVEDAQTEGREVE